MPSRWPGFCGGCGRGSSSARASSRTSTPIIRGWDGTLTIQGNEIVFTPAEGSNKKPQRFPIEHGEDFTGYWRSFLACCRSGKKETASPMDLAFSVQTAMQMGMLGLTQGKVARFDPAKEQIVL